MTRARRGSVRALTLTTLALLAIFSIQLASGDTRDDLPPASPTTPTDPASPSASAGATTQSATSTPTTGSLATDKAALKALYDATDGDNWTNNTGWDFTTDPDNSWFGVTVENGRVVGLRVGLWFLDYSLGFYEGGNLHGSLPSALGNLTQLRSLEIAGGPGLSGDIPPELGSLTNLEFLLLAGSNLTGTIPVELGNLSNLRWLVLQGNRLSGLIPRELASLTNLEELNLYNNALSGEVPSELAALSNLKTLYLHSNSLSGPIPTWLGTFKDLEFLHLGSNGLSGSIPTELSNLTNLELLYLSNNNLSGAVPASFAQLTMLRSIRVESTQICMPAGDVALSEWYYSLDFYNTDYNYIARPQIRTCIIPAAPTGLGASPLDAGGAVALSWSDPGDATITSWQTRYKSDGDFSAWSDVPNSTALTTSRTIDNLASWIEHTIELRAVNSDGPGPAASVTATPLGTQDYDTDDDGLIELSTLEHLDAIRLDLNGDGAADADNDITAYRLAFANGIVGMGCNDDELDETDQVCIGYELTALLDFDTNGDGVVDSGDDYWNGGAGWAPIGPYSGQLVGNGHAISNLFINRPTEADVGLFSELSGDVSGLGLANVNVTGGAATGGLAGSSENNTVQQVFISGTVSGTDDVGGLVGTTSGSALSESYATAAVTASGDRAGGLIATQTGGSTLNSYAAGAVSATDIAAGLVGSIDAGAIEDSYAVGLVTTDGVSGGLVAQAGATVTVSDSYWDSDTSGQLGSAAGTAQSTVSLQTPTSATGIFAAWDSSIWHFGGDDQHLVLQIDFNGDGVASWDEFGDQPTNRRPAVANAIADQTVPPTSTIQLHLTDELAPVFDDPDDDTLVLTATSSDPTVATVSLAAGVLSITGEEYGTVTITIVAKDSGRLSAVDTLTVRVWANRAPTMLNSLPNVNLAANASLAISLDSVGHMVFSDPDGDELALAATTTNASVATAFAADSSLYVFAEAKGSATVTVQATDPAGLSASVSFTVEVVDYDSDGDNLIEVTNWDQLNAIRYDLNGDGQVDNASDLASYRQAFPLASAATSCAGSCIGYELTNSLDFDTNGDDVVDSSDELWNSGAGWDPIGIDSGASNSAAYRGVFEGNDYVIKNLMVSRASRNEVGLFGALAGTLRNLTLEQVDIDGGVHGTGAAVGVLMANATVSGVHVSGEVEGSEAVGGLVGKAQEDGEISESSSTANVTGTRGVGGLVGNLIRESVVENSYVGLATVTGQQEVGGLIGLLWESSVLRYSYSAASVSGTLEVGGLIGDSDAALLVVDSYWDTDTSGQTTSAGGVGMPTSQLQAPTSATGMYADWDASIWDFGTASDYPELK